MIVLGIDPGSTRVGYGFIKTNGNHLEHLRSGLLAVSEGGLPKRLVTLEKSLETLIREMEPERVGIERLFFTKNQRTGIEVAEARGVLLACTARLGIPLVELTPGEVKVAVTGYGSATKTSVATMVFRLLGVTPSRTLDDVTDALAIAIAASSHQLGESPVH